MELYNKKIVITGGTAGIGYELVKLAHSESKVIVIGRDKEKLEKLKNEFNSIEVYQADLSDISQVMTTADQILKDHLEIDVLINNAAMQITPKFIDENFCIETGYKEVHLNFISICYLIYLFLPSLTKKTPSFILNINSGLALAPKTTSAIYCATKSALNTLSISLSYQFEKTNIKVLQAFLPLVDTGMTKGRGKNKISPRYAASEILQGLKAEKRNHYIGKVKLLVILLRFFPSLGYRILKQT